MSAYLAIRILLLVALALTAWWLVRPVSSASSLAMRRIGIGAVVAAAIVAILVPSLANTAARAIGVERGVNLIVYGLVIAQMVTGYRREARAEERMAALARSLALAHILPPDDPGDASTETSSSHADTSGVERAANGPSSPTNTPDNDMVTNDE